MGPDFSEEVSPGDTGPGLVVFSAARKASVSGTWPSSVFKAFETKRRVFSPDTCRAQPGSRPISLGKRSPLLVLRPRPLPLVEVLPPRHGTPGWSTPSRSREAFYPPHGTNPASYSPSVTFPPNVPDDARCSVYRASALRADSVPTGAQAPRGPDVGLRLPASSLPLTSYPHSSFSTLPAGRVPREVPQPGCVPRVPLLRGIITDRLCVKRTQRPLQLRAQWAQGPAVPPLSVLRTGRTAGTRQGQEPCSAGRETLSRAVVERVNVEATVGLHGGPQTGALAARLDCPAPRISVRGSLPGGAFPVLGVSPPWAMGSPPDKGRRPRG